MWFSWRRLTIDDYEQSSSCDRYFWVIYDYEQSYLCDMYSGVLYIKAFIFDNEIKKNTVLNSTETELRQLSMGAWGVPDS